MAAVVLCQDSEITLSVLFRFTENDRQVQIIRRVKRIVCERTEQVDFIVIFLGTGLVVTVDHVSRVAYAQFEKYRFFSEFFVYHRRVQNGHEQKELFVLTVRRLKTREHNIYDRTPETRLQNRFTSVIGYVGSTSTPEFMNSVFSVISVRIATNTLALYETPSPSPVLSVACLSRML